MPSIADIRKQYPDLAHLDDNSVVNVLHDAFYADLPREQVAAALGVKPPPEPVKPRTWGAVAQDTGISALKGAIGIPEAAVGIADLATGGQAGKMAEEAGFRPKEAKAILDDGYSTQQKEAFKKVSAADGLGDTFMAAVQNPSVIAHSIVESAPSMLAGGAVARGITAVAPKVGGVLASALGEGLVGGGSAAEQIRQKTADGLLTGEQAGLAGLTGIATTGFTMLGGKLAHKFGFADADSMMAGVAVTPEVRKHVVRSTIEGAISEGIFEELPQSVTEQVLQNKALGKPLDEGVDQAAVLGALSGGAMGAGANVLSSFKEPPAVVTPPPPPGPLTRAAQTVVQPAAPTIIVPPVVTPSITGMDMAQTLENQSSGSNSLMDSIRQNEAVQTPGATPAIAPLENPAIVPANQAQAGIFADSDAVKYVAQNTPPEAVKNGPQGPFKTPKEAEDYISTQRRSAGISLPAALPIEYPDNSHGIATAGSPDFAEAERQQKARSLIAAGVLEGDLLTVSGNIIKTKQAASSIAKKNGGDVVPVTGGFIVRPTAEVKDAPKTATQAEAANAGTPAGIEPAQQSTALAAPGAGVLEASGVKTNSLPRVQVGKVAESFTNQNAQTWRDLSDKRGLTEKIETLFYEGKTAANAATELDGSLAFLDKEDRLGFITSVRASLGIPSQMDEDGKGEFVAWKKSRDARLASQTPPKATPTPPKLSTNPAESTEVKGGINNAELIPQSNLGEISEKTPTKPRQNPDKAPTFGENPEKTRTTQATDTPPASKQGTEVPALPGLAKVQASKDIAAKQIPDMTDEELLKMQTFYAPDHKRAPKIAKAIADRGIGKTEPADSFVSVGAKAFADGEPRTPPAHMQNTGAILKEWYAGWDKANAAAPVEPVKPITNVVQAAKDSGKLIISHAGEKIAPKPASVQDTLKGAVSVDHLTNDQVDQVAAMFGVKKAGAGESIANEAIKDVAKTDQFANNKLFTADKVAAARARMKSKLGSLNSGIDPELLMDGMVVAGAYIESGVRSFAAFAKSMVDDMGDGVKPYLLSFWEGARNYPGMKNEGMTSATESAALHAELMTPEVKAQAAEALGEVVENPAKKTRKTGAKSDMTLTQDWGVPNIDGYNTDGDSETGNDTKTAFLKDAKNYLNAVSAVLAEQGYMPRLDNKGRAMKAVSVNESGVAGSGDVHLTLFNPDVGAGLYVTIGEASLRGMVPMTPSGIAVMFRASTEKDPYGGKGTNQWAPVDMSAADFAAMAHKHVQTAAPYLNNQVKIPQTLEKPSAKADTANEGTPNATSKLDSPSSGTLAGTPAKTVLGTEPDGTTAAGAETSGGTDGAGNEAADGSGGDPRRGVSGGAGAVPVSTGGTGKQPRGSKKPRLPGDPTPQQGFEFVDTTGGTGELIPVNPAPNAAAIPAPAFNDFTIEDDFALGEGGPKAKFKGNIEAIKLLQQLDAEGRGASPTEQGILARYVGWGGLAQAFDESNDAWAKEFAELKTLMSPDEYADARVSTRYAHYTSRQIIQDGIYAALKHMGFNGGRALEGGAGVGNFIGLMPADMRSNSRFTAIEREPFSAKLAKHLYPQQNIQEADFTEFVGNDDFYDVAVGNPPFASDPQVDRSGRKHLSGLSLHNYFFAKEVDMLREGGILAQVVTNSFLDALTDTARSYISDRTKFLGAIRLPNNAFSKNAGTEVTTDLIFIQKRPESEWGGKAAKADAKAWLATGKFVDSGGKTVALNQYFIDHPDMMLGDFGAFGTMYRPDATALVAKPGQDTGALLKAAVAKLPANVYVDRAISNTANMQDALVKTLQKPSVQENGYFEEDGKLFQRIKDIAGEARAKEITPLTQWTEKMKLGDAGFARIKALSGMRATVRSLLAAELSSNPAMEELRKTLNTQYDAYAKEFGLINDPGTLRVFDDDPDFPLLASLEHGYTPAIGVTAAKTMGIKPVPSKASKGPIFTQRVIDARQQVAKVETPADALAVSMAERGKLDAKYIGELLGRDSDEVLEELSSGAKPLLFKDPATGDYALRDAYLSGNVRAKLVQAKQAGMFNNIKALEEVQPEDVGSHEIVARVGSPWVPESVYQDFAKSLLGEGTNASIKYVKATAGYSAYITAGSEVANTNTWGTSHYPGTDILTALLNNKPIRVTFKDSDGNMYTSPQETENANAKAQDMRDKFQDWLFADSDRAEILGRAYNDTNNNYVTRAFDGEWMSFPGKVPDNVVKFRRHQRNAISRIVQDRTALLDHVVGSGKTYTVIASAMELRRTGLSRKPMIAVPNHLVKQWAADFYKLYPGANILTATKKDFEKSNRRKFLAKIATGDWDAVIIAHSSYGFIKPAPDFEYKFNQKQVKAIMDTIKEVENGDGDKQQKKRTVKQLEGIKERLENRIKALRDKPMDALLDFGELGVDQLFVDEAHMFKNLMFSTKMQNIAGLGDAKGSQRAYDMYVKANQIYDQNGRGQGVVFATGTPVSNSLAEMYHMMRYLMPMEMEEMGFQSFDAWANTYASVEQVWMQKASGDGFKAQNRMSNFVNTPELLKVFDQVSDTVTMDDIKAAYREENKGAEFPLPKLKGGKRTPVSLVKSAAQNEYMAKIADRALIVEQRKGPPEKGQDNILVIMSDARKAAMDIRLVDPTITEREPGGRIDKSSQEIFARYQQFDHVKGTQLVFSDLGTPLKSAKKELKEYQELKARIEAGAGEEVMQLAALGDEAAQDKVDDSEDAQAELDAKGRDWLGSMQSAERGFSVYDDLKAALVEKGIPEHEVAFIHDYNNDEQKAGLFRKMNAGQIRVLLGSTPKLGAGTNVQERLVALHHLDVPWKPSDVEQREGRIIRQGNKLDTLIPGFEVEVLAYVTQDTLDMRMWQVQETKLKMINQLRTRKIGREVDNAFEDLELSAGEMQAAATGNMDLLREIQIKGEVKKLEQRKRAFDAQKSDLQNRRKSVASKLEALPAKIASSKIMSDASDEYSDELVEQAKQFSVTIDGEVYTERRLASAALVERHEAHVYMQRQENGKFGGRQLTAEEVEKEPAQDPAAADYNPWARRPVPLSVDLNGTVYTSRDKLSEAASNELGDRDPVSWKIDGKTIVRRSLIQSAIRSPLAEAIAENEVRSLGSIGPFKVSAEGQTDKAGNWVEIVLSAGGQTISNSINTSMSEGVDLATALTPRIIGMVENMTHGASQQYDYQKRQFEQAQRDQKELGAVEGAGEWPEQGKLESMRSQHKEVLQRLSGAGVKVTADGDTLSGAMGEPNTAGNDTDVVFSRSQPDATAFKAWFGDSKVVDAQGKPMVVYHGTDADFAKFEAKENNLSWGGKDINLKMFNFTSDQAVAATYGNTVKPVYLSVKNPKILNARGATWDDFNPFGHAAQAFTDGHDGIIVKRIRDDHSGAGQESTTYIAFTQNQIKSATGNNGDFDPSNPDIRFSQGKNAAGLPPAQVKSMVDAIKAKWANAPEIIIATNMDDAQVPQAVRDHNNKMQSLGSSGSPNGFLYMGKVYLVADQLATPSDIMRVLFHEALGHVGLRGVFGESLTPILKQIAAFRQPEMIEKARQYGLLPPNMPADAKPSAILKAMGEKNRLIAAEELLAVMAQTKPELGFVKRAVAAIRNFLRSIGVKLELTDSDIIANYILPARRFVESGKAGSTGKAAAAFSRGEDGQKLTEKQFFDNYRQHIDLRGNPESAASVMRDGWKPLPHEVITVEKDGQSMYDAYKNALLGKSSTQSQTDTPAFKAWFGDSKVVDEDGKPMVVYHGTKHDFDVFRTDDELGAHFGTAQQADKVLDYWRAKGKTDGVNIKPVYLSLQNPLRLKDMGIFRASGVAPQLVSLGITSTEVKTTAEAKAIIEAAGYDGVVYKNTREGEGDSYIAFSPEQIKSATGNNGDFNPSNPDIRFSRSTTGELAKNTEAALKSSTVMDLPHKFGNRLADFRGMALQTLGRRQLVDIYAKDFPTLQSYSDMVAQMDADKNESGAEADALATGWGKLADERQLAELMHDATLAQIDPDKPFEQGDDENHYDALKHGFDALTEPAKKAYREARDMYADHNKKVRDAIKERIERSELRPAKKQALLEKMDNEFFKAIKGVYFPLARFGQYVTIVKDEVGNVVSVNRSETLNEAEATRKILLSQFSPASGHRVGKILKDREFNAVRDGVGRGFMADLFETLEKTDAGEELMDSISQLYLAALPDLSWAKHGIHRKGTPGFSQDARRAFAQNMFHGARYLAKLRYADQLQANLDSMQAHVTNQSENEAFDSVKAQQVVDEMVKRHDTMMNPQSNPLSTALTSFGFVFHLGLSPASALVNLSQTAMVALPVMGAKWGYGKSTAALLKASKETATNKNDISTVLQGDELAAYNEAVRSGVIDVTMAHDLAGIAQGEDSKVSAKIRPVMKWASFLFHHAEKFNRQVTFVAAYRLARETNTDHKNAYEQAVKATYDGHFDYSASNRPRVMQGNWQKVILLFKQYAQNMIYTLGRSAQQAIKAETPAGRAEARRALGGLLVSHAMAAGVFGLPMVGMLLSLASAIGGSDDEPWDAKIALQNMLADSFGTKAAEVFAHGLSRLTPWDISGRVGLDKLILPDVQEGLEGQRAVEAWMSAALGPVAGIAVNAGKGLADMGEGRYMRGLESMLPTALRGPLKAYRYGSEGNIDKTGIALNDEISVAGVAGQALGFSPSEARLAQEGKSAVYSADKAIQARRKELVNKFAKAAMDGNEDGKAEARKEISHFNEKNPKARIKPIQLAQSVQARRKRIRESENGIYLPTKRRDAMEAGRFAQADEE